MSQATPQRIQSLDRGLQILEYVAEQDQTVRLAELADLLGIEKSSAHRLAATLINRAYLKQDPDTLGYAVSDRVFTLAGKVASKRGLQQHARKFLKRVARETGEPSHLAVPTSAGPTFLDHEFGTHPIAVTTRWGQSEPYHCTAIGKALLAGMDKTDIQQALGPARLKAYTEKTITRISALVEECAEVVRTGVAYDREEYRLGMICIAAPIHDFRNCVIAAIGISGPVERMTAKILDKNCAILLTHARELSREMGYAE